MVRHCLNCNVELGFFSGGGLCKNCKDIYLKSEKIRINEYDKLIPKKCKVLKYVDGSNYFKSIIQEKDQLVNYKRELVECYKEYIKRYDNWDSVKENLFFANTNNLKFLIDLKKSKDSFVDIDITERLDKSGTIIAFALDNMKRREQKYFFTWVKNGELNLLDTEMYGIELFKIPLRNILSFTRKGDFYTHTNITGGGGGGSSIGGAIVGGVIAGSAGAIIGSRKKTNEIKTQNVVVEHRQTILELDINSNKEYVFFDSNSYDTLLELMPEKEINFVNKELERCNSNKNDIVDRIREFAKLKDEGILTEEEFQAKKKQLLDI